MWKHPVETLPFVIRYVADRYKTQEMCENILENGGTLKSDSYKNKQMYSKAFDNSTHILEFVFDCH